MEILGSVQKNFDSFVIGASAADCFDEDGIGGKCHLKTLRERVPKKILPSFLKNRKLFLVLARVRP